MKNCTHCNAQLMDSARFCHECGHRVPPTDAIACPTCGAENLNNASFCHRCGELLNGQKSSSQQRQYASYESEKTNKYKFDFRNNKFVINDIRQYFFAALQQLLVEEQNPKRYSDYLDTFYGCTFRDNFEKRAAQLAEELQDIHQRKGKEAPAEIDRLLDRTFDALLDHFVIVYCAHLNEVALPQTILKYATAKPNEYDIKQLIFDYLDLDKETGNTFYFDFVTMPSIKLKNAVKSFLFTADKTENPLLICDQTVFGSCKEGFAITDRGIYWKAHFNKPMFARFHQLTEISRQNEWISINGNYFHISKTLNTKVLKLLKKLKSLHFNI